MDFSSDDAVMSALTAAAQADDAADRGEQATAPAPTPETPAGSEQPNVQPPAQPEPPAQAATVDTFDEGAFNPDELPAELQAGWKQLQAAFTRKTQQLAEERRAFDALGSPEEVQQAVDLYTRISDPTNWPQLHADLSDLMQQYGLSPAQADAQAASMMEGAATAPAATAAPAIPSDLDPELAPLYETLKQTQDDLAALRAERATEVEQRQKAEQAQRLQDAINGELTRQENAIRQSNPAYGDGDMDAIYELSSYYGGNLLDAQRRYEALRADWIEQYVAMKGSAADAQGAHPAPAAAPVVTPTDGPKTMEQAAAEAEEYFRQLAANGELPEF